jgi:hypothetical protein
VRDINADVKPEVLLQATMGDGQHGGSQLTVFGADGALRWARSYGGTLSRGARRFSGCYLPAWLRVVEAGGRAYLVTGAHHRPFYPMIISLIDPRDGRTLQRYEHPGHLAKVALADLDEDGDAELLLGGINNPGPGPGPGHPVLLGLDVLLYGPGGSRREPRNLFGHESPRELFYYVLPRTSLDDRLGARSRIRQVLWEGEDRVVVSVKTEGGPLTLSLDVADVARPVVEVVALSSALRRTYREWAAAGQIAGTSEERDRKRFHGVAVFDAAPDGNSAEVRRALSAVAEGGHEEGRRVASPPERAASPLE